MYVGSQPLPASTRKLILTPVLYLQLEMRHSEPKWHKSTYIWENMCWATFSFSIHSHYSHCCSIWTVSQSISVWLLGWGISPSQGLYPYKEQHKHRINVHRHPRLRPRGHCFTIWAAIIKRLHYLVCYQTMTILCLQQSQNQHMARGKASILLQQRITHLKAIWYSYLQKFYTKIIFPSLKELVWK
jgi:hypothetical protein